MMGLSWAFFHAMPWIFIAAGAFVAWQRKKKSAALAAQAGLAGLMFILPVGGWFVIAVLNQMQAWRFSQWLGQGFGYLGVLLLFGFAGAYCWERFLGK
jgi:uncharacterized membrane protein